MNTIVTESVEIPSPEEFGVVWETFYLVVAAIAEYRANNLGTRRFGELATQASGVLGNAAFSDEMTKQVEDMADNEREQVALGVLFEEMQYVSWKYKSVFEFLGREIPEPIYSMGERFQGVEGDPGHSSAVDDVANVLDSVGKLLDKLPNWVRKIVDVILEALRFTRGDVG